MSRASRLCVDWASSNNCFAPISTSLLAHFGHGVMSELRSAFGGIAEVAFGAVRAALTHSGRWMFGRIFGLDGRESYRELRLELLLLPSPSKPRNCSA